MFVFRLASRKYEPDNSEGARLYGGRWNRPLTRVIYTSATRSLAALEVIAHHRAIPSDYRVIMIEIPDNLAIESVDRSDLPDNWPEEDSGEDTANYGTEWASSLRTAILRVPAATMPHESNYILNPEHPGFRHIRFDVPAQEYIDARLRQLRSD